MRRSETPISDGKAATATKREHDESAADVALNDAFRGGCPCRLAHAADGLDAYATGSAASFIVILMTGVLSICGLARIVAGSVDTFYLAFPGEASMSDYLRRFFIPTHVGNVFGTALMTVLNYGQVAPQVEEKKGGERQASNRSTFANLLSTRDVDGRTHCFRRSRTSGTSFGHACPIGSDR